METHDDDRRPSRHPAPRRRTKCVILWRLGDPYCEENLSDVSRRLPTAKYTTPTATTTIRHRPQERCHGTTRPTGLRTAQGPSRDRHRTHTPSQVHHAVRPLVITNMHLHRASEVALLSQTQSGRS